MALRKAIILPESFGYGTPAQVTSRTSGKLLKE
jgi:hypothetical protein